MAWSAAELEQAREAVSALLDELGLEAYLFAVEPRDGNWEVKVECAVQEGWETVTLPVDIRLLLASPVDREARARLAQAWDAKLAACRRAGRA
jgi:hypothetical protein